MMNIYNANGLDRADRNFSSAKELHLMESDFSLLFAKAMQVAAKKRMTLADGRNVSLADLYRYQPLVVCEEITSFEVSKLESLVHAACEEVFFDPTLKTMIVDLLVRIDDWRMRLEWTTLRNKTHYSLLDDINGPLKQKISANFQQLMLICPELRFPKMGSIWYSARINSLALPSEHDFLFRMGYQLVAFIKALQAKRARYHEEILSCGKMDPSLAMMVSFLTEYGKVTTNFNRRFAQMPAFYYNDILGVKKHAEKKGKLWISVAKTPNFASFVIPEKSILSVPQKDKSISCGLLSDLYVNNLQVENISVLKVEKSPIRHPEADLNFVTSLRHSLVYPEKREDTKKPGIGFRSSVLRLEGGKRTIVLLGTLTKESFLWFKNLMEKVAESQQISFRCAMEKVLNENTFIIQLSTPLGLKEVTSFKIDNVPCNNDECMIRLTIRLDANFPPVVPLEGGEPELRMLISDTAWLHPYSWCRIVNLKSVRIQVKVDDMKNFQLYNDLGLVDTTQPFSPFGGNADKGAWFAVGSYEMARKKVSHLSLSIDWRGLPNNRDGLQEYYKVYNDRGAHIQGQDPIDNKSFRVQGEFLSGYEWKSSGNEQYLFQTSSDKEIPEPNEPLVSNSTLRMALPSMPAYHLLEDDYVFGAVPSGFFRFRFSSPEIGFGTALYRRLFAEVMMLNSRTKVQLSMPEPPIQPVVASVGLSYEADAETEFVSGGTSDVEVFYQQLVISFSGQNGKFTAPIPIIHGVDEGVRLVISLSGAKDLNILNFYLEMNKLLTEVDQIQHVTWSYRTKAGWVDIRPFNILADETYGLLQSGFVSLLFPETITADMLEADGCFWVSAFVPKDMGVCSGVCAAYTNVACVQVDSDEAVPDAIPGLAAVKSVSQLEGFFFAETDEDMNIRIRERIQHRNRALLATDYERLVLQNFHQIDHVKCIPQKDTKGLHRKSLVTVVVLHKKHFDEDFPLCTDAELREIEFFLKQYISPFVEVDVINPVYEKVTVFGGLQLSDGVSSGDIIHKVENQLKLAIAPWHDGSVAPTLGMSFSVMDLRSALASIPQILAVFGLKVIHVCQSPGGLYERKVYTWEMSGNRDFSVAPSNEWSILLPDETFFLIPIQKEEDWRAQTGVGDFEIGETFVVETPPSMNNETLDC
ncbi:MAG TPA: hypothetical protein PLN63_07055 [Paludibacteraceae bacterium]|nr:hypothetical protein [Paludibacteraceae bacterium]HOU68600.1 hypothetical protein [Paludibacteraceae bacterium]HPH63360.1 hypothetical protein [Paludibacteraceae bacterium]